MILYKCEAAGCDKVFSKSCNLKAHRRLHTGEKPFVCSFPNCGKALMWKSSLKSHEKSHVREKKIAQASEEGSGTEQEQTNLSEGSPVTDIHTPASAHGEVLGQDQIVATYPAVETVYIESNLTFSADDVNRGDLTPLYMAESQKPVLKSELSVSNMLAGPPDVELVSQMLEQSMSIGGNPGDRSGLRGERLDVEVQYVNEEIFDDTLDNLEYYYNLEVSPVPSPMMSRGPSRVMDRADSKNPQRMMTHADSRMMAISRGNSRLFSFKDSPMSRDASLRNVCVKPSNPPHFQNDVGLWSF